MKTEAAQGQLVMMVEGRIVALDIPATADLVAFMEVRGFACKGPRSDKYRLRLRPELQEAPTFAGLVGPCWGGEDRPLRYETSEVNDILSR